MSRFTDWMILVSLMWSQGLTKGSSCPAFEAIFPCFCTTTSQDNGAVVICPGIQSSQQLHEITKSMKGLILERFILLNAFHNSDNNSELNEVNSTSERVRLPKNWLAFVRVRELEIVFSSLSSCFLCDEPLIGQGEFLSSLVATHASLDGHLCYSCNTKTKSVSTKELQRTTQLKLVDLSWNNIQIVDGNAFPPNMRELKKVVLSNNKINKIHDNAFSNLYQITELDISNNELTSIPKRMVRSPNPTLRILDLSWNSLQTLPEDIFYGMNALKEVRLSYNLLEVLPVTTWSRIPSLMEKIDVKGNFLACNCSMSWISQRLGRSTKVNGKCVTPKEMEAQEIKSTLSSIQNCGST